MLKNLQKEQQMWTSDTKWNPSAVSRAMSDQSGNVGMWTLRRCSKILVIEDEWIESD